MERQTLTTEETLEDLAAKREELQISEWEYDAARRKILGPETPAPSKLKQALILGAIVVLALGTLAFPFPEQFALLAGFLGAMALLGVVFAARSMW